MSIKWNKMLVTGYKEIDDEHREAVDEANKVFQVIKTKDVDSVLTAIERFIAHIKEHFQSEEKIMEEYGLSQLDSHRELHKNYLMMASGVLDDFIENRSIPKIKKNFKTLYHAMIKHIINFDIPIFEIIRDMQIKPQN